MRLSLRLTVERDGRRRRPRPYLDDPVLLFVPVRLLMGLIVDDRGDRLRDLDRRRRLQGSARPAALDGGIRARLRAPAAAADCPPRSRARADHAAAVVQRYRAGRCHPITRSLVGIIVTLRRERPVPAPSNGVPPEEDENGDAAHAYLEAGEQEGLIEREERRLIESIVDFGDTLVREVMTPRPDIVAIPIDATLAEVQAGLRRAAVLAGSRLPGVARSHRRVRLREGPDSAARSCRRPSAWCRSCCGRPTTCPRPSGSPSC